MLLKIMLPALVLIAVFSSCDKNNGDDPQPYSVDSFELVAPAMNAVTTFDSVLFTWKGSADTYRLQINNGAIVDTVLTSKFFLLRKLLTPGITIPWRVIAGTDTLTRTFKTENLALNYLGFFSMNLRKYHYGDPNVGFPDSFFNNVVVEIQPANGNELRVRYGTVFDKQLNFATYLTNDSIIGYGNTSGGSGQCYFRHNIRTDSIYVSNSYGGLGGGAIYYFRGKK